MQERASPIATDGEQALILIDPENLGLVHTSRNARAALGYTEEQLQGMSLTDILVHPAGAELDRLIGALRGEACAEVAVAALLRAQRGRTIAVELVMMKLGLAEPPLLALLTKASTETSPPATTSRMGRSKVRAKAWSRSSWAGTAMMAPVP